MTRSFPRIRQALRAVQTGWSIAGLTLLALLATEAGLRLVFAIKDHFAIAESPDPRVVASGYGGQRWPRQHYRELELLEDRWEPYVYFRQRPISGQTISIDQQGLRLTWQPPPAPSADYDEARIIRVLSLGGSSLWGFGARNDHTIPSLFARKVHDQGYRLEVRNLAEIGYVSTQEMIALIRELQAGYRPHLVIFYDGVNDTTSALLEGEAGVTTNERNRRAEFNIRQSPARLGAAMIGRLVQDSASFRFAQVVGRRLAGGQVTIGGLPSTDQRRELVAEVVRRYRANLSIVRELAQGFRFEVLHYWQPVIFDKESLTPSEREEAEKFKWCRDFVQEVYKAIRGSTDLGAERRFHDLSRLFVQSQELIFIDYCHTTESANEQIAESMAHDALDVLRSADLGKRGGGPQGHSVR